MKNLLKGAAVLIVVMIVSMAVHVFCNIKGIELNPTLASTVSSVSSMLIYRGLTKTDKNKDNQ